MNITNTNPKNKNKGLIIKKYGANLLIGLALFLLPNISFAVTQGDLNQKAQELEAARQSLSSTQSKRLTLQGEVANYDSQIANIQGDINDTQARINQLNSDITKTQKRIVEAQAKPGDARLKLGDIIKTSYEDAQQSSIEVIAKSENFSDYVNRSTYLESVQISVTERAQEIVSLKNELEAKKKALQADKKKAEDLKKQILAQQQQVSVQRSAKDALLQETKGDEAAYRARVKKIQQDYAYLESLLWSGNGNYVSLGHVNAGDIIGYIGNSGYSTGCHLHFEIRTASQASRNPMSYVGNGYFIHPVPGVWMSAPYGYSNAYFPGVFHSGVDFADGCARTPIRATAEGDIVARVSGRPNTYPWSLEYGNYAKIRHTNGMYSLYGHMR